LFFGAGSGNRTHLSSLEGWSITDIRYPHVYLYYVFNLMERVVGIEPTFLAWKARVLPIYDTRNIFFNINGAENGIRTRSLHLGKVALYR
jgi:hypothetical protein